MDYCNSFAWEADMTSGEICDYACHSKSTVKHTLVKKKCAELY